MGLRTDVIQLFTKPNRYLFRVILPGDPTGRVVRMVVGKKDVELFHSTVKVVFADYPGVEKFNVSHMFKVSVGKLASEIPGIDMVVKHPVTKADRSIDEIIMDLNDNHGWSREKIADWLDTLDAQPTFDGKLEI